VNEIVCHTSLYGNVYTSLCLYVSIHMSGHRLREGGGGMRGGGGGVWRHTKQAVRVSHALGKYVFVFFSSILT